MVNEKSLNQVQKLEERRVSVRMLFVSKVACRMAEIDRQITGQFRDISINGLFMEMNDRPEVGQECVIAVILEGEHSRLIIEDIAGVIVRRTEKGVGVRFDQRLEWFALIPLYLKKMHGKSRPK